MLISLFDKKGGKQRPALVIKKDDEDILEVLTINSQYEHKSQNIKDQYFPLADWQKEGLKKQSYVDIRYLSKIYMPFQKHLYKIGQIRVTDLKAFIISYQQRKH